MNGDAVFQGISIVVAVFALLVSGLALSRMLRNDLRKDAMIAGASDEILKEIRARLNLTDGVAQKAETLRQDLDSLKDTVGKTASGLQDHLLECARRQGLIDGKMQSLLEGQEKHGRAMASIQRMIATLSQRSSPN